jgi:hypothetical protein
MKNKQIFSGATRLAAACAIAALAGCGGGGDSGSGSGPGDLPGSITITGTAATVTAGVASNAIGGAAVNAVCARGDGSTMTNADGTFSVTIAKPGVGPCVLALFRADNVSLRSIATGSGNFNITPMTELLVQYISTQVSSTAVPVTPGTANAPNVLAENLTFAKLLASPALLSNSVARAGVIARSFPAPATAGLVVPQDYLSAQLAARTATGTGNAQNAFLEALRARNTITTAGALNGTTASEAAKDALLNKVTLP